MTKLELLIFVAFATLVYCTDVEDSEQKKRGVGKGTALNSITTGAQKQDYTYSIYSSNPSSQSSSSPSYQSQVPNSFYPNQATNQYYSSTTTQSDPSSYSQQQQTQPQYNLLPPPTNSQFIPLNFIPNSGYQPKYQIIPSKSNGNIQLAIYPQTGNYHSPQIIPYNPQFFSPNPTTQMSSHQGYNIGQPQGQFNIAQTYQQLPLGGQPYLGQASSMLLFAQPNLNQLYNNLVYPNSLQNLFTYYPANPQSKNNVQYATQGSSVDYDKLQGPLGQSIPKEDNEITHSSEYTLPSDTSSSYKTTYSAGRNSYTKL